MPVDFLLAGERASFRYIPIMAVVDRLRGVAFMASDGIPWLVLSMLAEINLESVIVFAGRWLFVPIMLIFLLVFSVFLAIQRTETLEQRLANIMALVVGAVIFACLIVFDALGMLGGVGVLQYEPVGAYFVFGAVFGFVLLAVADKFLTTNTRSFFIMPVSAASLSGIYFYLIGEQYRNSILLVLLGLLLGLALYGWMFPAVFRDLMGIKFPVRARPVVRGERQ